MTRFANIAVVTLLCSPVAHAQSVLVVHPASGPYITLQTAVLAATDGDTILISSGSYAGVTVAKPLALVADVGAIVSITSKVEVHGVTAGNSVLLRGLSIAPAAFADGPAVYIHDCAGFVAVEDCALSIGAESFSRVELDALRIVDARAVSLLRSGVEGGHSVSAGRSGGKALHAERSTVYALESTFVGGDGSASFFQAPQDGGAGVFLDDAVVYLGDSATRGGSGASAVSFFCTAAGDGGAGVEMGGVTAHLHVRSADLAGGAGGTSSQPTCPAGNDGSLISVAGGSISTWSAPWLALAATPVAREGEAVTFTIRGPAKIPVALALSLQPSPLIIPLLQAPLLTGTTFLGMPLGIVEANGTLSAVASVPELGNGIESARCFAQVIGLDPINGPTAGAGQWITLLDAAF